jgi:HAD superfamily hydrolase (TIGR01509 family)
MAAIRLSVKKKEFLKMNSIVFDMDGVLFATEALIDRIWAEMMIAHNMPEMIPVLQDCRGRNRADTYAFFAEHYPDFDYASLSDEKRERVNAELDRSGMPLMEGAEALLQALRAANWKVALATSTNRESTMHHLELAGFVDYFDVIITGDQIAHGKPHPQIYLTACAQLQSRPEETYAVEDSPNGIRSAHAAGMQVFMVPDQVAPTEELRQMATVLPSLVDVRKHLFGI